MFVCCYNKRLKRELLDFNRLYAYPNEPDINDKMVILDSGAFHLSKSGKRMDDKYIDSLATHYKRFHQFKNVHCIAPDTFKNPFDSMRKYKEFKEKYPNISICPVIQSKSSNIDIFDIKKQIKFYDDHEFICFSNNKFDPVKQKQELKYIRGLIPDKTWVHVLGAGYSHNNVKDWVKLGYNSIDSVSYYTDAESKIKWVKNSYNTEPSVYEFKKTALFNAKIANYI